MAIVFNLSFPNSFRSLNISPGRIYIYLIVGTNVNGASLAYPRSTLRGSTRLFQHTANIVAVRRGKSSAWLILALESNALQLPLVIYIILSPFVKNLKAPVYDAKPAIILA